MWLWLKVLHEVLVNLFVGWGFSVSLRGITRGRFASKLIHMIVGLSSSLMVGQSSVLHYVGLFIGSVFS
jgi:hypothetical protein